MKQRLVLLLLPIGLLFGCTGLRYATEEQPLFAGFDIKWEQAPEEDRKSIREELDALVRPAPNNTILWMRPTVALHNMIKEPKQQKGLGHLLKNKIGSKPVYLADVPAKDINDAVVNRLNNHGYFSASSRYVVERSGRRARIIFHVTAGPPHRLRNIIYADRSDSLNARIARAQARSPLSAGQPYDLAVLKAERQRVAGTLRNAGWYHITDEDLLFSADTSMGGHLMDLRLRVKTTIKEIARQRYTVEHVEVHGDLDEQSPPRDTIRVDSLDYVDYYETYRPTTITRGVFIHPGAHYSERATEQTESHLGSFGVFRSARVEYTADSVVPGTLDARVMLIPQKRWALFGELNAISKSNNFAGPGARVGIKDRNLFGGAEIFNANVNGRFETQVTKEGTASNAVELGIQTSLQIPRIVPFQFLNTIRSSAPTTRAEAGYGFFKRSDLYGLNSGNLSFGYVWRQNPRIWHDVRAVEISVNSLFYSSEEFTAFLDTNPAVKQSFEQQFILGTGYTFTITTKRRNDRTAYLVASIGVDGSGNLASLFSRITGEPRPDEGYVLFGQRFSQYVRLRPELRFYSPAGPHGGRVVARLIAGAGLPYGNSEVMPYVKQFFVGGTNSVRAFPARTVGPGTYAPEETSGVLIDQAGDIRLEGNLECRFPLAGYFKGALFVDAGNIWLVNNDPQRPGGAFAWDRVLPELAVGAGLGLRFDMGVIVVRFDVAKPLRDPSLPEDQRWVFNNPDKSVFGDVIGNIAIGYPF